MTLALALAALLSAEVTVDLRDYITQPDPGYRHRGRFFGTVDSGLSTDGYYARGEWSQALVIEPGNPYGFPAGGLWGAHFVSLGPAGMLGVYRDLAGPFGPWRCFAGIGETCFARMADTPPQAAPLVLTVPVLASVSPERVTTEAPPVQPGWAGHDVWLMDPTTCTEYGFEQRIWQRVRVFVLARADFGGDLGSRDDVLVLEAELYSTGQADRNPPARTASGHRLERYYFARGWGMARQMGRSGSAGLFNGPLGETGDVTWSQRVPGDFHASPICVQPSLPWLTLGRP